MLERFFNDLRDHPLVVRDFRRWRRRLRKFALPILFGVLLWLLLANIFQALAGIGNARTASRALNLLFEPWPLLIIAGVVPLLLATYHLAPMIGGCEAEELLIGTITRDRIVAGLCFTFWLRTLAWLGAIFAIWLIFVVPFANAPITYNRLGLSILLPLALIPLELVYCSALLAIVLRRRRRDAILIDGSLHLFLLYPAAIILLGVFFVLMVIILGVPFMTFCFLLVEGTITGQSSWLRSYVFVPFFIMIAVSYLFLWTSWLTQLNLEVAESYCVPGDWLRKDKSSPSQLLARWFFGQ